MHIDKQAKLSILIMLSSSRCTETAKEEGLWLAYRPKHLVQNTQMTAAATAAVMLCFYSYLPQ